MITDERINNLYNMFRTVQKHLHKNRLDKQHYDCVWKRFKCKEFMLGFSSAWLNFKLEFKNKTIEFSAYNSISNFKTFIIMVNSIEKKFIDKFELMLNEKLIEII